VTGSRERKNLNVKDVRRLMVNHSRENVKLMHVLKIKKLTTVESAMIFLVRDSWKDMIPMKVLLTL